jgi:iron complex outermembrane recepter protein
MIKNLFYLLAIACMFSLQLSAQSISCNAEIHLIVKDAQHNLPISGAVIVLDESKAFQTSTNGELNLKSICNGNHILKITMLGYASESKAIEISDGHNELEILLNHTSSTELNTVEITSNLIQHQRNEMHQMDEKTIQKLQYLDYTQALANLEGVQVSSTGSNINKPNVGGLRGQRIVQVSNGIRQEGQQWCEDHAPELDLFMFDNIAIETGIAKLQYGNDAIGGAIISSNDQQKLEETHVDAFSNFQWNGRLSKTGFKVQVKPFKSPFWEMNIAVVGTISGNLKNPDYYLPNTSTRAMFQHLLLQKRTTKTHFSIFQSTAYQQFGILANAHIGNVSDLQRAIELGKPDFSTSFSYQLNLPYQEVSHRQAGLEWKRFVNAHQMLYFKSSFQQNQRKEFDRARNFDGSPQLDLSHFSQQTEVGIQELIFNRYLIQTAFQSNVMFNRWSGNYLVPNYFAWNKGMYFTINRQLKYWSNKAIVRYDLFNRTAYFNQSNVFSDQDELLQGFSGGYQISYQSNNFYSDLDIMHSWRPPSINELHSRGVHHGAGFFEQGDPNLGKEQVWQIQHHTSIKLFDKIHWHINPYISYFNNFINLLPDTQLVLTLRGAFVRYKYSQQEVTLNGINTRIELPLFNLLNAQISWEMLGMYKAQLSSNPVRLPYNEVQFQVLFPSKHGLPEIQFITEYFYKNNTADLVRDYASPPKNYVLNHVQVNGTLPFLPKLDCSLGCRNGFNIKYNQYLNTFRYFAQEPGRNYYITIIYHIQ